MIDINSNMKISPKVLVVEDDDLVRNVVLRLLEKLGYTALGVDDGAKALFESREMADRGESFGVAIIDSNLPDGLEGVDVAMALRKSDPKLKTILTSGDLSKATQSRLKLWDGFIAKPFEMNGLKEILTQVLGESKSQ
jgi:CheY-like chemotaxis protein